jgi:hypothetical protein
MNWMPLRDFIPHIWLTNLKVVSSICVNSSILYIRMSEISVQKLWRGLFSTRSKLLENWKREIRITSRRRTISRKFLDQDKPQNFPRNRMTTSTWNRKSPFFNHLSSGSSVFFFYVQDLKKKHKTKQNKFKNQCSIIFLGRKKENLCEWIVCVYSALVYLFIIISLLCGIPIEKCFTVEWLASRVCLCLLFLCWISLSII